MIKNQQEHEVLMKISDMYIQTFNAESEFLSSSKLVAEKLEAACKFVFDIMKNYL